MVFISDSNNYSNLTFEQKVYKIVEIHTEIEGLNKEDCASLFKYYVGKSEEFVNEELEFAEYLLTK
jgi:hypothetical protein